MPIAEVPRVAGPPSKETLQGALKDVLRGSRTFSPAQAERVDQLAVAVEVLALQVIEQRAALADHLQQATPAVVVLVVVLQVLGQVRDALGQERDLNLRRTGVAWALLELRCVCLRTVETASVYSSRQRRVATRNECRGRGWAKPVGFSRRKPCRR